jgi:radical SAM superfamily enzyme YgiQ (UPF0313 family)
MLAYLADLGHNLVTATSDTYPLGVGNLAAYVSANLSNSPVEFQLFREPEELKAAIDARSPDVLGVASYAWNHRLALSFVRYAKQRNPGVLSVMGGPNFPLTREEQEEWMRSMPEIDVHTRGPTYEGERAFLNVIQRFVDVGRNVKGLFDETVPGNLWIHPRTGEFQGAEELPRIRDLDEIPSPYLAGYMDKFFQTGYFALMQLARGCPFTCQFCNSSPRSNSKAFRHSFENVKADLDYIVERINRASPLCFADDNFGMYEQDEEVADYLGHLMDRYDWPKYIRTTTGKNKGERIIRVMRKARGRLPMTSAVQSLNPVVLKNIQRDNISLDTYAQIQKELHDQGMQAYGELILAMPGETADSFMEAVDKLIETGVSRVSAHQLMLLHGAPLANPDQRQQFGLKTRYRVVARCLGKYTGELEVETEEMVVESAQFSFQDYIDTRVFHLLLTIYFYEGNFEEVFKFGREIGIRPFQIVKRMQELLDQGPEPMRRAVADYIAENIGELFETREACVAWAAENYDALISGELGGNLLSKYSMIGRFYVVQDALDFLRQAVRSLIAEQRFGDLEALEALDEIIDYIKAVVLHAPFRESLAHTPSFSSRYDIPAWQEQDYLRPLVEFRRTALCEVATSVDPRVREVIESRIQTFGEHPSGLGRFTRTMFARDLRRQVREQQPN